MKKELHHRMSLPPSAAEAVVRRLSSVVSFRGVLYLLASTLFPFCLSGCGEDYSTNEPIRTVQAAVSNDAWVVEGGLDWPQWRGVKRDGISLEEGLINGWGEDGPVEVWRSSLGDGYSGLAVTSGRVYTLFQTDAEYVVCLDALTGEEIWRTKSDSAYRTSQGDGPRGAPVVHEGIVYTVGGQGKFMALDAFDGSVLWSHKLTGTLKGALPEWGFATAPLVDGNRVYVEPGGTGGHSIAAFDWRTGKLVWSGYRDLAGYSSAVSVDIAGSHQILFFTAKHLIGMSPEKDEVLWETPWETSYDVNAATPIFIPPNRVFVSSGYGVGGGVFEIRSEGGTYKAETVWKNREMKNHFNSSVFFEGHLYGFDDGTLKCLDAGTGERMWRQRGFGKGSLIVADRKLWILSDRGVLALAEATPGEYRELARTQILKGKCWTSPSLAQRKLYLRNQTEVVCLDLTGTPR